MNFKPKSMAIPARRSPDPADTLPSELFLAILGRLQSLRDLRNCCLVCRTWSRPSQETLFRHLYLNEVTITRFRDRQPCIAPHLQKAVQSLTLRFEAVPAFFESSPVAVMEPLISVVANMTNLKSFSYYCGNDWSDDEDIHTELFAKKLLENLPEACTSIDLENNNQLYGNTVHVCPVIRSLLPRLRHLRFSWPMMCPELFESTHGAEDDGSHPPATKANLETCFLIELDAMGDSACPCSGRETGEGNALQPLLRSISSRLQAGNLSASKNIVVVSKRDDWWHNFVRHDYGLGKSLSLPLSSSGPGGEYLLRLPEDEGGYWVGDCLSEVMEMAGKRMWLTTTQGIRLPAALMRYYELDYESPMTTVVEWEERCGVEWTMELRNRFDSWSAEIREGGIHEQLDVT